MAIVAVGLKIAFISILVPWLINMLTSVMGGFFYTIALGLFKMIDILQDVFRKLAGLEPVYVSNGGLTGTGGAQDNVILSILTNSRVIEILITMTMFAVALLIIATIVQLIRVEYTTEGAKNSKGSILGLSIKSLGMFLLVPFLCVVGVGVSTTLLKAVDSATSAGGATSISGSLFLAGASEASPLRTGGREYVSDGYISGGTGSFFKVQDDGYAAKSKLFGTSIDLFEVFGTTRSGDEEQQKATLANAVDSAFSRSLSDAIQLKEEQQFGDLPIGGVFNYSNMLAVRYFYNFGDMNFIVLYIGAGFALTCLFKACFGLIMRMYKIAALFIISPGVIALQPLDGGNAYKSWRKNFIGSVLGAYGIVIALNLFFFLISIINTIKLFPEENTLQIMVNAPVNFWIKAVFTLVGLLMINDLSAQISGYLGADDALKQGEGMAKNVGGTMAKYGTAATKIAMGAGGLASALGGKIAKSKLQKQDAKEEEAGKTAKANFLRNAGVSDESQLSERQKEEMNKQIDEAKNKVGMNEKTRQRLTTQAARGQVGLNRTKELLSDSFQSSGPISLLNNMTGKYIKDFGGKALADLDSKAGNDDGSLKMAKMQGVVGGALSDANLNLRAKKLSKQSGISHEEAIEQIMKQDKAKAARKAKNAGYVDSVVQTYNSQQAARQTGQDTIDQIDPQTQLNLNNEAFARTLNNILDMRKAGKSTDDMEPLLKELQKLNKQFKGTLKASDQTARDATINAIQAAITSKNASAAGLAAHDALKNKAETTNAKFDTSSSGYANLNNEFNAMKKQVKDAVEKYVEGASENLIKQATMNFDSKTGGSFGASAKLESIVKEYTTKMEEAAKKAAEKAAEKAYQESLAKMIAKFSKK